MATAGETGNTSSLGGSPSLRELRRKMHLVYRVFHDVTNWPVYFADFFGLTKGPFIEYHFRNGAKCKLRPRSTDRLIVNDIWLSEVYWKGDDIREGDVVIDIGAHIGVFSLFAASRGARVYSFEPHPENYQILLNNISINEMQDRIFPFNLAIWSSRASLDLHLAGDRTGSHSMFGEAEECIRVQSITLREVFDNEGIAKCRLIKMDAEGAEYPILYTAPPDILARIERISLEYHDLSAVQPNHQHLRLKEFLEERGFRVTLHEPPFLVMHAMKD